jgi:hypothetical protein
VLNTLLCSSRSLYATESVPVADARTEGAFLLPEPRAGQISATAPRELSADVLRGAALTAGKESFLSWGGTAMQPAESQPTFRSSMSSGRTVFRKKAASRHVKML